MTSQSEKTGGISDRGRQKLSPPKNLPGHILLKKIEEKEIEADNLSPVNRRLCVRVLRYKRGWTKGEIAEILKCNLRTIQRDYRRVERDNIDLITNFEALREYAEALARSEHYEQKELKAGKHSRAWKIRKERVELLQSLGFLPHDLGTLNINKNISEQRLIEFRELDERTKAEIAIGILRAERTLGAEA